MDVEKEEALSIALATTNSPSSTLIKEGNELAAKIASETDADKLNDLTQLFNMNQKKKDMARVNRLNNLLELIDDEVVTRFTTYPDSFDHDQLLSYMRATTSAINNTNQQINQAPVVQINNNMTEVNINQSGLNRESREKVMSAVNQILSSLQKKEDSDIIDIDIEEKD